MDASFVSKSGDKAYWLGNFYNGKQGKAEAGLEISSLAIVDVGFNTAYHVSTRQTPVKTKDADGSRVTAYLDHFKIDCHVLPKDTRHLVTDASQQATVHQRRVGVRLPPSRQAAL